ncbi:UNVERIFIED_CONTAM: hypothetical protein FKN15_056679 [Acipenser sinensis]
MLYLKKYLTEGLIQFTILLSLIGVRVDVDTYLSSQLSPLREIILGPSSAYTQTQFHNLRNTLDGYGLHPKSVDLDYYFTARRLLGEVRSLDRLQVPSTELSAWLVHRDAEVSSPQSGSSSGIALENASGGLEEVGNPEGSAMRGNGSLDQGYVQESEENLGAVAPEDSNELHNDSRSNNLTKETMLYLKKYLTEGLIQFTILLSLIGVRVDVDTYLSSQLSPLREIILGPSSAYTQTQFHNLRNTLDGYGLHPKSVDLDYYFTARRLLGEVRSLDRLQVPSTELSAWLVHRDAEVSSPQSGSSSGIALENASGGLEEVGNPEGSAMRGNGSLDQGYFQESEENLGAVAPEDSNELHNDSRSNNLTKEVWNCGAWWCL